MGHPKLELFASNGVHICHAIYHGPSKSKNDSRMHRAKVA